MPLTEEEARVCRQTLEMAERQLEDIDRQIENELAAVRERLGELQEKRKAALQMYDAACAMLGIPREREGSEEAPPQNSK